MWILRAEKAQSKVQVYLEIRNQLVAEGSYEFRIITNFELLNKVIISDDFD